LCERLISGAGWELEGEAVFCFVNENPENKLTNNIRNKNFELAFHKRERAISIKHLSTTAGTAKPLRQIYRHLLATEGVAAQD